MRGSQLDDLGMLVDFSLLKDRLKQVLKEFDHSLLNEHAYFSHSTPTAENLAKMLYTAQQALPSQVTLCKVRVYETPDAWVDYEGEQPCQA